MAASLHPQAHRIIDFSCLENDDIFDQPEKHERLIAEMKLEAALITNNSPYAMVRSVVDNKDDPSMPVSTIRAWVMGIFFSAAVAFVNNFFEIRFPAIAIGQNVPQLLAYPIGKFLEKSLPDVGITLFGVRHSLNPGPFNRKEHMLITLMVTIAKSSPYTNYIIWMQYLPQFFNQKWAASFGYQIMIALSTNFIGYGMAGLCRRFLVYPSYCVWPASLAIVALNAAFHGDSNPAVQGPLKSVWRMSRIKFFLIAFSLMFCYFWFPNFIFSALAIFSWMTWIAPNNRNLTLLTGSRKGLGLNPIPTFDWNIVITSVDPLVAPIFTTLNFFAGGVIFMFTILAVYWSNSYYTAFLPIVSNKPYDRFAQQYNVSMVVDERGILDTEKYKAYSLPYLSASQLISFTCFFCIYTASLTHAFLYHRVELQMGFRDLINGFRPSKRQDLDKGRVLDVHNRLMKEYAEVPEWWYFITMVISVVLGCVAISHWPTYTSPAVVFYGIILCAIFVIPVGIIFAMTGVEVSLNVLAEFIGGSFVEGNALSMCFFKTYGYITCSHALHFSNDLKLAHYLKIPPRHTFWAQMIPTLVSTFVCVGVLQYQIKIKDVCSINAPFNFSCPSQTTYFTSALLWGTVGPKKLWGKGGTYAATLAGFPAGIIIVLAFWYAGKRFPKNKILRSCHPVVMLFGGVIWIPYNMTFLWPAIPVAAFSWLYIKKRFLGLWAKVWSLSPFQV